MRKTICLLLIVAILFASSGCAGRTANPIETYLPGDETRTCQGLKTEMNQLDADMRGLLPKTDKGGGNLLLGAAGLFLIVPWFFMDFKGAERIEYDAFRNRYNHLIVIAADKSCDVGSRQRIPSIEEVKRMSKEEKEAYIKAMESDTTG